MKKKLIILLAVFSIYSAQAQEDDEKEEKIATLPVGKDRVKKSEGPWTREGNFTFLMNQSSYSNWQAGGNNSISGSVKINYDFNYKKDDLDWDNKLIADYGLTKILGRDQKKTADRLEFNSLLGKQIKDNWYYSAFLNFKTQMDRGMDQDGEYNSHFMSPAYLQIGPGVLWKKSDDLKVNIAPITSRFIFVHSHFTEEGEKFGVEQGKSMKYQLGMAINGYYKFDIMENVSAENILSLFSNYLSQPENIVIDYQLNIVLKVNKYLSTNFTFQTVYEDLAIKRFQIREIVGVGVNYHF